MFRNSLVWSLVVLLTISLQLWGEEPKKAELPTLPKDFVVHAVGTYAGKAKLDDVALDDSAHEVRQAEVVVNLPGKPVVLVLTAYDPTVWRIGVAPMTEIAAVFVSGVHGQAVIGVPNELPVVISAHKQRGPFAPFYAYGASRQLLAMNEAVAKLVGREIDRFEFKAKDGVFLVGEPLLEGEKPLYSDDRKVTSVAKPGEPPAGDKGLEQLVKDGLLRPATDADIEAWVAKASEKYARFNPELRVGHHMRVGDTYVVLKELKLPDGLYGAHSRSFIVPDGTPFPGGPKCHNSFYLMDGTAKGPGVD
jgi:hypothetical protein